MLHCLSLDCSYILPLFFPHSRNLSIRSLLLAMAFRSQSKASPWPNLDKDLESYNPAPTPPPNAILTSEQEQLFNYDPRRTSHRQYLGRGYVEGSYKGIFYHQMNVLLDLQWKADDEDIDAFTVQKSFKDLYETKAGVG